MVTRAGASRPSDWADWLCNLGWLGAVGSAAAVALAVVLPFTRMFVTLLVVDKQQTGAGLHRCLGYINVVVLSGGIVSAGESWHADGQQSGHGSGQQQRLD